MAVNITTQYGIVAFLDILGYANFLENNEPEDAAKTLIDILSMAPKKWVTSGGMAPGSRASLWLARCRAATQRAVQQSEARCTTLLRGVPGRS